jgi:cytochrome c5
MLLNPLEKLLKKQILFYSLVLVSISLIGCGKEKKPPVSTSNKIVIKQEFKDKVAEKHTDGYLFLETSCLYCHKMDNSLQDDSNAIAPTMQEVRNTYKKVYPSKSDFIDAMTKFKLKPSTDNSLMQDAIKKYGTMPDTGITKEDIEEIAAYLFDYKF